FTNNLKQGPTRALALVPRKRRYTSLRIQETYNKKLKTQNFLFDEQRELNSMSRQQQEEETTANAATSTQTVQITAKNTSWKELASREEESQSSASTNTQHYREFKEAFKTKNKDYLNKAAQEIESFSKTEEKEEQKEEETSTEMPDKQEIRDISHSTDDEMEDTQENAEQVTTFSEAELTTRDELALDNLYLKDNNKENSPPHENTSSETPMEEDFTTVSYKKKKKKQTNQSIRKQATVRQAPYRKGRIEENSSKAQ
ncbi:9618_t:CDS:2, partial [Ambispora leptoticha]